MPPRGSGGLLRGRAGSDDVCLLWAVSTRRARPLRLMSSPGGKRELRPQGLYTLGLPLLGGAWGWCLPVGNEPSSRTERWSLGFVLLPGAPGARLRPCRGEGRLGIGTLFDLFWKPVYRCDPGDATDAVREIAEGANASVKHSFFFAEFSVFRFSCFSYFAVRVFFFFNLTFSPLPIGKCVLHIFLECLLFPPRTRAGLALWGLKLNQLGGPTLKGECKNVNIKLATKLIIFIWNEKPQYIRSFKKQSSVGHHRT